VLVGLAVASAALVVAMRLYPGGSAIEPHAAGHSFWLNFVCDLTGNVAANGRPNPVGSVVGRAGISTFAATLIPFWLLLPATFFSTNGTRWRGATPLRATGVVSALGLATVPFATGGLHAWAVYAAALPGIAAGALGLVGTLKFVRSRLVVTLLCGAIGAAVVDSALYAQSLMTHPRVVIPALPATQRIAFLLIVAWMVTVAVRGFKKDHFSR